VGWDLFPVSADGDAEAFTDEHGGRTITFDDIDRTLIEGIRREM
jgi:copper chaperone NosL